MLLFAILCTELEYREHEHRRYLEENERDAGPVHVDPGEDHEAASGPGDVDTGCSQHALFRDRVSSEQDDQENDIRHDHEPGDPQEPDRQVGDVRNDIGPRDHQDPGDGADERIGGDRPVEGRCPDPRNGAHHISLAFNRVRRAASRRNR